MLKLKKVAVTGGLSSGKSLFCSYLQKLGAYVVSADEIVHQLLSPKTSLGQKVIALLGSDVVTDEKINRNIIAEKVFEDLEKLKALEKILHPEVLEEIEREYINCQNKESYPLFVAEIPLLFEIQGERYFDETVAVVADKTQSVEWFKKTSGLGEKEYHLRMSRQYPAEIKAEKANHIIYNNGDKELLYAKAKQLYQRLTTIK